MRRVIRVLGVALLGVAILVLPGSPAWAWETPVPCDFLTGGGFILRFGFHANFGVGGGCKNGHPWGHLEYIDHGTGLNVHWTSITAYMKDFVLAHPRARIICGTARTNQFGDVFFAVRADDFSPPGPGNGNDFFDMRLRSQTTGLVVYQTFDDGVFPHPLAGGNLMLHKPNPSTTGGPFIDCPGF